jgi:hypothetical protein
VGAGVGASDERRERAHALRRSEKPILVVVMSPNLRFLP